MRRFVALTAFVVVAAGSIGISAPPAAGAYPGRNGRIAYVSPRAGGPGTQLEIFTINQDGTGRRRLTDNDVNDDDPVFSPDGTKIAFEREVGGLDEELFIMNADGSRVRRLTDNDCRDANPTWSPNGLKLAYDSDCPPSAARDIWKMRLSTRNAVQLTDDPLDDRHPAWSVDNEIAFERAEGFTSVDIWRIDANGTDEEQLTSGGDHDQDPSWSPNGELIAFERLPAGTFTFEVWRMRRNGNEERRLSVGADHAGQPAYAPNGRRIAFVHAPSDAIGARQIYTMVASGGGGQPVTDENSYAEKPDWQPR